MKKIICVPNMAAQARMEALATLKDCGLTFADCVQAFGDNDSDSYVAAAQNKVQEGDLEVDIPTVVSRGADGAYVQAWVWVSNREAGILTHSEVLEEVLEHARVALEKPLDLEAEEKKLRNIQSDWLEDLITNFADELDEIESEVPKAPGIPGSIAWVTEDNVKVRFMPSDAISQLRLLARQHGLPDNVSDQAERFVSQYGNKLDAILTVGPLPALAMRFYKFCRASAGSSVDEDSAMTWLKQHRPGLWARLLCEDLRSMPLRYLG